MRATTRSYCGMRSSSFDTTTTDNNNNNGGRFLQQRRIWWCVIQQCSVLMMMMMLILLVDQPGPCQGFFMDENRFPRRHTQQSRVPISFQTAKRWVRQSSAAGVPQEEKQHARLFMTTGSSSLSSSVSPKNVASPLSKQQASQLQYNDLRWKLVLPPEESWWEQWQWRWTAYRIRFWDSPRRGVDPPAVCCPPPPSNSRRNVHAILEAYASARLEENETPALRKVGRFGITTVPGPPLTLEASTVSQLFNDDEHSSSSTNDNCLDEPPMAFSCAALIFMWVDPAYRGRGIGNLALEMVRWIHGRQGCDMTVLVADDNGSGKLVEWYERQGFVRTPELQEPFGSPNQIYGIAMAGRTITQAPSSSSSSPPWTIEWW